MKIVDLEPGLITNKKLGITNFMKAVYQKELKTGDLLFTSHPSCNMSQAIDLVTQTGRDTHFSHIGIVEIAPGGIMVYHSSPRNGVCCEKLNAFIHPGDIDNLIMVYRLKDVFSDSIPHAIKAAKGFLGESYNHIFSIISPGYYCSEFIYRIFAPDRIFELSPMTFKDPEGKDYITHWVAYYHQHGIPIPERQPGCNPNGMAASEKLLLLGKLC